jgi:mRNA interferase MazF
VRRGEVWWADLDPPISRRPVLLISRNEAYDVRTSVVVAVITRTVRKIPVEVGLTVADGMPQDCVVNLDDILLVRKERLSRFITRLSDEKLRLVDEALRYSLGLV